MVEIKECWVSDIFNASTFSKLSDEYAEECALDGLPHPKPDASIYENLEAFCGPSFIVLGAFEGGELVGFIVVMVSINPHYGQMFATSESFFVLPSHRNGGAGLKLRAEAKRLAKERGAIAFKTSARVGSRLDDILQKTDARHSNNVYTEIL